MRGYSGIVRVMAGMGLRRGLQHRTEFLLEGILSVVTIASQMVPVAVLFAERGAIAGWSYGQVLVLLGWFLIVIGLLQGVITSSFSQSISGIRTGQFDYMLLKPADPLLLASIANLRPWKLVDMVAGMALVGVGLVELGRSPSLSDVLLAACMTGCALVTLYALYVLAVAGSFRLVRIENLMNVLSSLIDFGRWPIQVFEGVWRILFTVILPIGIITSHPAMALLGTISWREALLSVLVAGVFAGVARVVWNLAIASYASASS